MSGALPAPCLPPLLGCWAISRWTEAGGFPREALQEKGGGPGRKPPEPSWNPPDWKEPGQRQGEERGGWAGALPLRQDLAKERGLLPRAAPAWARPPAGHQQVRERARPGHLQSQEACGGCWRRAARSGGSGSGSEFCVQWPWCHLLAGRGAASGTPTLPGAPQAIDLSSHSTLGGWYSGWPGLPQVHARANRSWLSPRRAQIPCQPGILSQLSRWPAVAEAAAAQGCQNHDIRASC